MRNKKQQISASFLWDLGFDTSLGCLYCFGSDIFHGPPPSQTTLHALCADRRVLFAGSGKRWESREVWKALQIHETFFIFFYFDLYLERRCMKNSKALNQPTTGFRGAVRVHTVTWPNCVTVELATWSLCWVLFLAFFPSYCMISLRVSPYFHHV